MMLHGFRFLDVNNAHFELDGLLVWLIQPSGLASRLVRPGRLTTAMVDLINGPATTAMLAHYEETLRPMRFVHDWREVTGYDSEARRRLVAQGLRLGAKKTESVDIVLAAGSSSLVKMGTAVGDALLSAAGMKMRVHYEMTELASLGLLDLRPLPPLSRP